MYKLTIRDNNTNNSKLDEMYVSHEVLKIGRNADNDIRLDDATVSSHHAEIVQSHTSVIIRDCNSTNGTYVNGTSIDTHKLIDEDVIVVGKLTISFLQDKPAPLTEEIDPTATISRGEMQHLLERIEQLKSGGSSTVTVSRKLNWIAQNENGVWWGFEIEPDLGESDWENKQNGMKILLKEEQSNENWKDTLQKL